MLSQLSKQKPAHAESAYYKKRDSMGMGYNSQLIMSSYLDDDDDDVCLCVCYQERGTVCAQYRAIQSDR